MRGPAAVGVLQAKDGAYFATYLSSHSGQNRYPYNFDKMDSATRNVDALKGIVGTTKWIPFVNERDAGNPTNAQSAQELPSA